MSTISNNNLRNSNIELLRILLMFMVITLHFNNGEMGGALNYLEDAQFNRFLFYFFESVSVCSVNCFMIISGYFLSGNKKVKLGKIIDLCLIVIVYRFFDYILMIMTGNIPFEIKKFLVRLLPANYFAIFYLISYFLSPFINVVFDSISIKNQRKLLCGVLFIFVLWPSLVDLGQDILKINLSSVSTFSTHGNLSGYTIVMFIVDLMIGIFIRRFDFQLKSWKLCIVFFLNTIILTFGVSKLPSLYYYCSIFTVSNAVCLFLLFNKLVFQSKFINFISKSVFSIFCIHTLPVSCLLWKTYFVTENHLTKNILVSLLWLIVSVFVMFVFSLIIDLCFRYTLGLLKDKICKKMPCIIDLESKDE